MSQSTDSRVCNSRPDPVCEMTACGGQATRDALFAAARRLKAHSRFALVAVIVARRDRALQHMLSLVSG